MLIKWQELVHELNVKPNGVLHVGAHLGEEKNYYESSNMLPVYWVEAREDLVVEMKKNLVPPQHFVIHALLWREAGIRMKMNIASNSQSSSILELADHKVLYPEINYVGTIEMNTTTLDELMDSGINCEMIVLDLQGAELEVLKGLSGDKWNRIKWIYSEVFTRDLYEGCAKIHEIDDFLAGKGFYRLFTRMQRNHGWGDAIYSSQKRAPISYKIMRLKTKELWKVIKFRIWLLRNGKA